jgi:hypothetical protein
MQSKSFVRTGSIILSMGFLILLMSLPALAQTDYSMDVVTPDYIEADTVLPLSGDDGFLEVPLPFSFPFYGVAYDRAYVSTNGYLNFVEGNFWYYNLPLPTVTPPNAAIYPFWDDLYVDSSASVRSELLGAAPNRRFVIEWKNVRFFDDFSRRLNFEVVLYETGTILLQYRNVNNDAREMGGTATIGIEDHTGTVAMQFSYNSSAIGPGDFAIQFVDPPSGGRSVPVDIKPQGCPNPLNVHSQGVLPVAILGTADFDVTTIAPETVTLEGVPALRWRLKDVATPYDPDPFPGEIDPYQCNTQGPDGYLDLVFKFDTQELVAALGGAKDKEVLTLHLSGELLDGTEIDGEDVVIIKNKKLPR